MKAKIALATAASLIVVAAAYASGDGAKTMRPPRSLIIAPGLGILDDADEPPEPLPGQTTAIEITPDGEERCIIFAAPPAPPGTIVAQFVRDPRDNEFLLDSHAKSFRFDTDLEKPAAEGEEALAKQVKKVLRRARPENPAGRGRSFVQLVRQGYRVDELSWDMVIKDVKPIPRGWRATVWVYAQLTPRGQTRLFTHGHIEVYRFEDGKLTLESDRTPPGWDPLQGFASMRF